MELHIKILVICIEFLTVTAGTEHGSNNIERSLLNHLFKNYSSTVIPVNDPFGALDVSFNVKLIKLQDMDERNQRITVQAIYESSWVNQQLTWDPHKWGNITELYVKGDKVWTPDLTLINNADDKGPEPHKGTDLVILLPNGVNLWAPKITLKSFFQLHVRFFPFDIQNCSFRYRSWDIDESKLTLNHENPPFESENDTNDWSMIDESYVSSSEWKVFSTYKRTVPYQYRDFPVTYTEVIFTFVFLRKPLYFIITAVIPVIILMAIVLCSYFLPANSGERMGVLITVLLAFAVYLESITSSLPHNADSTSILSIFYLVSMAECAIAFLGTCFVITLIRNPSSSPPPNWLRKRFLKTLSKDEKEERKTSNDAAGVEYRYSKGEKQLFVGRNNDGINNRWSSISSNQRDMFSKASISQLSNITEGQNEILNKLDVIIRAMKEQNGYLRMKCIAMDDTDKLGKIQNEWKELAEVLDRVCLWVFLISFIIASTCIVVPAYIHQENTLVHNSGRLNK